jgi:hypothetical protein
MGGLEAAYCAQIAENKKDQLDGPLAFNLIAG